MQIISLINLWGTSEVSTQLCCVLTHLQSEAAKAGGTTEEQKWKKVAILEDIPYPSEINSADIMN